MTSDRLTGLVAILRGLTPDRAADVGEALVSAGLTTVEVPLNSPDPLQSITILREQLGARARVGAGTVLDPVSVVAAQEAGAQLIVCPNTDPDVVTEAVAAGLPVYPGVATVSEAFTAIRYGARAVKIFPADQVGAVAVRAWQAVLPPEVELVPVGGVGPAGFAEWVAAGASGFGIGSALFTPDAPVGQLQERAETIVAAWNAVSAQVRDVPGGR
ncbi:2-dehydro-3-deoxy-6-phosphogalactonate aldolase [Ruania albidiflava]|uniref:2-dehydro-3-deoxy-6-phosphogalactonate aldolase n=1 Tax=Ruania albidiflava TaxID=366586 RepID=UPI0003B313E1|nr:2-dehydro-3-deoxy-6-phosphogalactonate aldolase [Ruania albidiflava]